DARHLRGEIGAERDHLSAAIDGAKRLGPEDVRALDGRGHHLSIPALFEDLAERGFAAAQPAGRLEEEVLRSRKWRRRIQAERILTGSRLLSRARCTG